MIDVMDKNFQDFLHLSKSQSANVQFAHYLGYFLMALPAGWLARRLSYKSGIIVGLFNPFFSALRSGLRLMQRPSPPDSLGSLRSAGFSRRVWPAEAGAPLHSPSYSIFHTPAQRGFWR